MRLDLVPGLVAAAAAAALAMTSAWLRSPLLGLAAAVVTVVALVVFEAAWVARRRASATPAPGSEPLADHPGSAVDPASVVDRDTGLPHNQVFELILEARLAIARRRLWPLALVLIEIQPMQTAGHFAVLLRRTLREADTACRTGPSTFAVILDDTDEVGGVWTAERIQVAVAKEREAETAGIQFQVAASVAGYPSHAMRADQLLIAAEAALDRARGHGSSRRGVGAVEVARVEP